jgi:glycosyltransferase involved in cell wall biosynthesis
MVQTGRNTANRLTLASGETADPAWRSRLRRNLPDIRLEFAVEPTFHYLAEQRATVTDIRKRLLSAIAGLLAGTPASSTTIWAHNLGLGRNLLLAEALVEVCARHQVPLVAHHHDWWFDNRWRRWPELRSAGFGTLKAAAEALFSPQPLVRHAAINSADARILARHMGQRSGWLPNPVEKPPAPSTAAVQRARQWLTRTMGDDAPLWLLPCRLLRRKNIAEALLLTRWLRPGACLVTTGGPSSPEEGPYHARLQAAATEANWPLRLGVLANARRDRPTIPELMAASEVVLLTSIQEGFGLPYLEAAAAGRPLLGRLLPNVAPDLKRFGFRLPQTYRELHVPFGLFDAKAEVERQARLFRSWKASLPRTCQRWVEPPVLLTAGTRKDRVSFSRLTLTAQLEVLAHPPEASWSACTPVNPFLPKWRRRAEDNGFHVSAWPEKASAWLSGPAYARRLWKLVRSSANPAPSKASAAAVQRDFMRARLSREFLYPLLWSPES